MPPPVIEEDIDDLDDVLEQFNAPPSRPAPKPPVQSKTAVAPTEVPENPFNDEAFAALFSASKGADADDFEAQFAAAMEALIRNEFEGPSDPTVSTSTLPGPSKAVPATNNPVEDPAQALKAAWEKILEEDLNGNPSDETSSKVEDDFQRAIREATGKLKESREKHAAEESAPADDLSNLWKTLSDLDLDGEGGQEMQGVLETLMTQLMSKEILYDPLKELNGKFPGYLKENESKLSSDDLKKYSAQHDIVTKVLAIFDAPDYSEDNAEMSTKVVALMSEMQALGSPPTEIMGDLPPGMDIGEDGLPNIGGDGCVIC